MEVVDWETPRRSLEAEYERLQHRSDETLPPLPGRLLRDSTGSVLDSLDVHRTLDTGAAVDVVGRLAEELRKHDD